MQVELIEIDRIVEDPDQPRRHLDDETLQGLADSIRQHGVLQPITVAAVHSVNMYRIVTGERRWRASRLAGLEVIPSIVREVPAEDVLTEQLIENLQREDLQPIDKARAVKQIRGRLNATNREVAGRLGISERAVGYLLDLLDLPDDISEQVVSSPNRPADGQITEKHARFLKQLNEDPDLQSAVVGRVRDERISSDDTGKLVKALRRAPERTEEILAAPRDAYTRILRELDAAGGDAEPPLPAAPPAQPSPYADRVAEIASMLEPIRPNTMPHPQVRNLQDALTSVRMVIDALIRECKMELGETP